MGWGVCGGGGHMPRKHSVTREAGVTNAVMALQPRVPFMFSLTFTR